MDTVVEITLAPPYAHEPEKVWPKADSLMKDWEERFSQSGERSEIRAVNGRASRCVKASPVLTEMVSLGRDYGDTTGGWFDITILPIKELWGFGERDTFQPIPPEESVEKTVLRVGYRRIHCDRRANEICIDSQSTVIDIGGIAKGFALREMDGLLRSLGYENYLIVAGGDIISRGRRHDGTPWKIGIQHPRKPARLIATFELDSGCVVTSGDYERFRIIDGVRYHHIFNPFTGRCCLENQSVTIWGMNPVEIDILSTALFCLSHEEILSFVETRPRIECVVVDSGGRVYVSSGLQTRIRICTETDDAL